MSQLQSLQGSLAAATSQIAALESQAQRLQAASDADKAVLSKRAAEAEAERDRLEGQCLRESQQRSAAIGIDFTWRPCGGA